MKKYLSLIIIASFINASCASAQNNRINTHESIGWYGLFSTFKVSKKVGILTEYQWRRDNIITDWQQSLLRVGVNYQANPRVLLRLGYAWIETFPYGEIPINGLGRDFTEHRIFQMAQITHKESKIDFTHRFMLEQRFIGRYSTAVQTKEDQFPLLHRMRYMCKLQTPLTKKTKSPYIALYDEIHIGFGKNVNANIFDQNRIGVMLGYSFNKSFRLEGGYINQTVQFGRQINGQSVFQNNNGIVVNANFNFDLTKPTK